MKLKVCLRKQVHDSIDFSLKYQFAKHLEILFAHSEMEKQA